MHNHYRQSLCCKFCPDLLALSNSNFTPINQPFHTHCPQPSLLTFSLWISQPWWTPSPRDTPRHRLFIRAQGPCATCLSEPSSSCLTLTVSSPIHTMAKDRQEVSRYVCGRHFLCLLSSWWTHIVILYLAIINTTTRNLRMQTALWHTDFLPFGTQGG